MTLEGWTRPDRGALFVITGPSGVGKSTLIQGAMSALPGLEFSVSATTRAPREGERDGVDYHFVDQARYDAHLAAGDFLEHATVYGSGYATLREPVERALAAGRSVILDIDLQGSRQVRRTWTEAVHLMILPPDLDTLEERLRARATDSEEIIRGRMEAVAEQLSGVGEYDYLVVNDHLPTAARVLEGILAAELCRTPRRPGLVKRVLADIARRD